MKNSHPLISVIIPTWNSARFLPQALDSVFAQQYEPCEVIVVDDGSTDNTAVILGAYADRITCIRQANAGSASARNTGLQHARGEYVVFLDADDWLLPGKLHVQADFLNTHPEYGMAHSGWFLCDEAGNVLQIVEPWTEVPDLTLVNWLKHRPVNLGAFMFRREWLERVGGMDPSLRQSHDVDLVLRLALAGCQAGWVCLPTMAYRRHRKSTTLAGALQQARCSVAVIDRFFERPDLPPEVAEMATGTRYYSALWAAWYLLDKGLVEEVASYLQLCRSLSEKRPLPLVFDWLMHLVRWTERAGRPVEQVMAIVPVVVAVVPEVAGGLWERFVGWWLARRPFLAADAFALAWSVFQELAVLETDEIALELIADCWFWLWQPVLAGQTAVSPPPVLFTWTPRQLLRAAQQGIVHRPDLIGRADVYRFWQAVTEAGLFQPDDKGALAALYLTLLGQKGMGRQWREASRALTAVFPLGFSAGVRHAWQDFIQTGWQYLVTTYHLPARIKGDR